jgi:PAS domain S-box-containing protein
VARRATKAGRRARSLDAETLDFMFPCHFETDRALRIVSPGPGLQRLAPEALPGALLKDVFRFESPFEPSSAEDMALLGSNQVVLAMRRDERLKLRGVIAPQPDGASLFLLSPVIADGSAAADLHIDFNSLSPCDGSAELVIATEMQRIMTAEAKELAERLGVARDKAVERQAFFDTILQLLPAMVMVKDAKDGRYLLVNATAEDVLGIAAEEMLGRSVFDLFPRKEAVKFTAEDAEVIASGGMKVEQEEAITTRSRGQRYFITKKLATYGEEGARYVVTVGEDVTERHEAETALRKALKAAEAASLSKSTFLANMSHEIRTPLNGIVAIADILSRAELPAKAQDLIQIIQTSGETLERLLSDILDLARVESHQITIEVAPFHLGELARATAALARLRADEKGVQVEVRLDAQVDRVMAGDMVRVRQVLTNLLSNAVKFTAAGRVRLTISRTAAGPLRFLVEDTGVGFDQDAKARVFGRFQQADDTITRRFGGSGLGLAISRELVGLMGGALDCDSLPGVGSSFWFEIPLEPAEALDARPAPRGAGAQSANLPRVLVADDHPTNRKVVELMLEGQAEIVSVENGEEAIAAFRSEAFDLVLMDMQMPVMDGLTAVREIRRCEVAASRVPIIMLTANALPEHVAASLAAGADLHLDKPITAASLFAAIDEATDRSATFGAPAEAQG